MTAEGRQLALKRTWPVRRLPWALILGLVLALLMVSLPVVLLGCGDNPGGDGTTTMSEVGGPAISGSETTQTAEKIGGQAWAEALAMRVSSSVVEVRAIISSSLFSKDFATGGGVVYRGDGMVVTNDHVITAETVTPKKHLMVILASGDKLEASVVGRDPQADLAVLHIDREGLTPLPFVRNLSDISDGEAAVAIGSRSLDQNVSGGAVTDILRGVHAPSVNQLQTLIQTDVPVERGYSGGPLLNQEGRVMGIVLAETTGMPNAQEGFGIAIPAPTVVEVADRILASAP